MAKKPTSAKKSAAPYTPEVVPPPVAKPPAASTLIDTPVPKPAAALSAATPQASKVENAPRAVTWELISERAYFISISGTGGDQDYNWHRAEAELKSEADGE